MKVDRKVLGAVRNFYAAGLNYLAHIEWANSRGASHKVPAQPDIGYRSAAALIGSGHDIVIPADSPGPVEYEGELVAVIGRKARNVPEAEALECVRGYTLGNDVSERAGRRATARCGARRARHLQADGAEDRLGHRSDEPGDRGARQRPHRVELQHPRHDLRRGALHRAHVALRDADPDDIIWFGCDGPTEPALKPGDLVEVANEAIGVLANRVMREA